MRWLRKRIAWIAGTAVGGLLIWLVGSVVSIQATQSEAAGILFGKKVPIQNYLKAREAVTHQAILTHGDRFRQEVSEESLDRQAWERLVLLAEARRRGIRVSDEQVVKDLQKWPLFQKESRFDQPSYEMILRYSLGTTPRTFEEEFRELLIIDKLFTQAVAEPILTEPELRETFERREGAIRVSALIVPSEPLAREIAEASRISPDQLQRTAGQLDAAIIVPGFFRREDTVPEFDLSGSALETAFFLSPGEVAGRPIQSPKGWLVVRLEERRPPDEEKFHQTKEELDRQARSSKKLMTYMEWYQDLQSRANLKKLR